MRMLKRAVAVLLIISMLAMAGCAGGNTSWVFRSGNREVSAGLYIIFQLTAFSDAEQIIASENPDAYQGASPKELLAMSVEGQPFADWVSAKAQVYAREYFAVLEKCDSLGIELTDEELSSIDSATASTIEGSNGFYEKNGVSESSMRNFYSCNYKRSKLFTQIYGEGGESAVSDDEIRTHLNETYVLIDAMVFSKPYTVPEGETKTLDDLTAELKITAMEYFERLKSGTEIEDLAYEYDLSTATQDNLESITKPEKGQLELIVSESSRESYGDALTDAALGASIGTPVLVEDPNFYALINRKDILANTEFFDTYRDSLLSGMKSEEFDAKITEWSGAIQFEVNQAAVSRYNPTKLQFDDTAADSTLPTA